jgi:hypothetical protein
VRRLLPLLLVALGALVAAVVITGLPSNVPSDVISGTLTTTAGAPSVTSSVTADPRPTISSTATTLRVATTPASTVAAPPTTTPTTLPVVPATTAGPVSTPASPPPSTPAEPGTLTVVVANAGPADRLASRMATVIAALGYTQTVIATSASRRPVSEIYFAPGRDQDALALATVVEVAATQVHPFPGTQLTVDDARGDLWLVVGNDLLQRIEGVG